MVETVLSRVTQVSLREASQLTSFQRRVDETVGRFLEEAVDPRSLAAMTAGSLFFSLGRVGVLSAASRLGVQNGAVVQLASYGVGLVSEVTAFEGTGRVWATLAGDRSNPNLWNWSGQGGWGQGMASSLVTFSALKSAGALAQDQNFILQHLFSDMAMVGGHQISASLGFTPRPEGSLAEQMMHAEAVNLQLGMGMGMVHSAFPALRAVERGLHFTLLAQQEARRDRVFSSLPFSQDPLLVEASSGVRRLLPFQFLDGGSEEKAPIFAMSMTPPGKDKKDADSPLIAGGVFAHQENSVGEFLQMDLDGFAPAELSGGAETPIDEEAFHHFVRLLKPPNENEPERTFLFDPTQNLRQLEFTLKIMSMEERMRLADRMAEREDLKTFFEWSEAAVRRANDEDFLLPIFQVFSLFLRQSKGASDGFLEFVETAAPYLREEKGRAQIWKETEEELLNLSNERENGHHTSRLDALLRRNQDAGFPLPTVERLLALAARNVYQDPKRENRRVLNLSVQRIVAERWKNVGSARIYLEAAYLARKMNLGGDRVGARNVLRHAEGEIQLRPGQKTSADLFLLRRLRALMDHVDFLMMNTLFPTSLDFQKMGDYYHHPEAAYFLPLETVLRPLLERLNTRKGKYSQEDRDRVFVAVQDLLGREELSPLAGLRGRGEAQGTGSPATSAVNETAEDVLRSFSSASSFEQADWPTQITRLGNALIDEGNFEGAYSVLTFLHGMEVGDPMTFANLAVSAVTQIEIFQNQKRFVGSPERMNRIKQRFMLWQEELSL